ncbi:YfcC family protein [soil metagenome]
MVTPLHTGAGISKTLLSFAAMSNGKSLMSPLTILMIVIVLAAIATWILPAGKYNTLELQNKNFVIHESDSENIVSFSQKTLDSLGIKISPEKFESGAIRKPVAIPGTYHSLPPNSQGIIEVIEAPLKGIMDSMDIILFLLVIGGFINVFNNTGAMIEGLKALSHKMKGREAWLIIILTFLFSFGGSSYGMAEEGLVFYPVLIPLFLAAGYDLLVPVAVIFGGTNLGTLSSFSNPFSTIIASNAAGVNWSEGLTERILIFILSTILFIWFIVKYANRIKKDPSKSLVPKDIRYHFPVTSPSTSDIITTVSARNKLLLFIFLGTFLGMIAGVVWFDWWLLEMSSLFLFSSVLVAIVVKLGEKKFLDQFIKGAESMLGVAFIIGVARGVTLVLNDGKVSDSILYYSSNLVQHMPSSVFIVSLLILFMIFTLFIASSSGMAVLTMPIIGALAIIMNVPGREIVNSYLFGMGIMGFLTPTGLILPSLALCGLNFKTWWKFIFPFLIMLFILCAVTLIIGVYVS